MNTLPPTAVIVPVLNEEAYILACLASLIDPNPECLRQVILVDGGSTDRTLELVADLAKTHPCLSVLHNSKRLQSAAMNLAARLAAPEIRVLLRADAHALYSPGFVDACVATLANTGAASAVVPLRTVGVTGRQRAIAAAQNSRLGNGGSAHRIGRTGRFVEHGHHAAFDRDWFMRVGGYDERFSHNEDAEFDYRLTQAGGRIWMAEPAVTYFPRRTFWSLAKQYMRHGAGRAKTIKLHKVRPRLRQLMPLCLLATTLGGFALMPFSLWFGVVPLFYLALCFAWGAAEAARSRDVWLLAMGPAAITMHLAWAIGFIRSYLGPAQVPAAPIAYGSQPS